MVKRLIIKLTILTIVLGGVLSLVPSAFASTLNLSPGLITTAPGQTFTVSVRLNALGDNINTVAAYLNYPPNLVDAISIKDSGSAFSIKAAADINAGTVKIARGNFSGLSGNLFVASITFKAKAVGKSSIYFVSGSKAPRTSDHSDSLDLSKSNGTVVNVLASLPKTSATPTQLGLKPEISDLDFTNIASNSATVVWKTNIPTDSYVEFGTDPNNYIANVSESKLVADHSINLTSQLFSAGQIFHIRVTSKDAKGNAAVSEDKILHFKGAAIKIMVTDKNNTPVNNAQIFLYSDPFQTFTDQNGDAYFADVVPGKHSILVKLGSYKKTNDIIVADVSQVQTFAIKLSIAVPGTNNQLFDRNKILITEIVVLAILIMILILFIRRRSGGPKIKNPNDKAQTPPNSNHSIPESVTSSENSNQP